MENKKLRTLELTKATPATQLTPAQRPRRRADAWRRDKNAGGADHYVIQGPCMPSLQPPGTVSCRLKS
jgi:hypothetical protein